MAQIRQIKNRIKAVGNIKRITRTMQMIATTKFTKAQHKATATKPYTEGVFDLVTQLAGTAGNISHPLIDGPTGGAKAGAKPLLLVLTSDRGLCGPYNGSLIRTALKALRADDLACEVVGKKGAGTLKFYGFAIDKHHTQFGDDPQFEDVAKLAEQYMERFKGGEVASVSVLFMRFVSAGRQYPDTIQLLPLKPPAQDGEGGTSAEYEFSPPANELLDDLLPETVKTTLFQCFNDAIVSEHVARMVAMKAATDNAGKMGKELNRKYNRARQAQITTELTEIVSGAAALE